MNALRKDLVERKLWMLVAALVVAVAAVPVFLLKGASASTTPTVPAPPAATGSVENTQTDTAPSKRTEPTKVVLARIARDPFASGVQKLSPTPASRPSTSPPASSTPVAPASTAGTPSSGSPTSVSMVSPSPAPSNAQASGASTPASSGSTSTGSTTTTSTTAPTSTIASAPPTTQRARPAEVRSWTTYAVSVRFGADTSAPIRTNVARLTPLPSTRQPEIMFMGVLSTGRSAVFALRQDVGHTGPGLCRPDHALCSAMVLKAGQTEHVTIPTASGGQSKLILRVVKITSSITHSRKVALAAYQRVSHGGLCDLLLADPMLYHLGTGTLSRIPKSICAEYPHATPFSYGGSGS